MILTIYEWMRYAVNTFLTVRFVARTDDDVWLDVASLQSYLRAVYRAYGKDSLVLAGGMLYSSWIEEATGESDHGFG